LAMTLLYLLRHGEIDWPETDCFIGQTDAPLSLRGRLQVEAWRSQLRNMEFGAVWSSDLKRATESAAIVFEGRAAGIQTSKELREIQLGAWEGRPRRQVREEHPDLWLARGGDLAGFRPPAGESFLDLQERVVRAIRRIAAETFSTACLVTHAGVIRSLICHCLQMPLENLFRIRLDYGSLSIVALAAERIEVCALNLKPSNIIGSADAKMGSLHDPAHV
jgi:alpha-ribazole phosphatase